ncbi:MAG: tail fiber protein [Thiohalocapsa sp.]
MANRHHKQIGLVAGTLGMLATLGIASSPAYAQQEGFIGEIKFFGGNFAPRGWAFCDGQLLAISGNSALFSILGTAYGGDGRTTFALPDMRGRSPVHQGSGPGLPTVRLGAKGGAERFTLTAAQMPSHSHSADTSTTTDTTTTMAAYSGGGTMNSPAGNVLADDGSDRIYSDQAPDVSMNAAAVIYTSTSDSTTTIGNTGGSQSVSHRSPYVAVNCIIALQGIFPSRN